MSESEVSLRVATRGTQGARKDLADVASGVREIGTASAAAGQQSESGLGRTKAAAESANSSTSKAADSFTAAGRNASLFVSVPLTAFLFKSAHAAMDLNDTVDATRFAFGRSGDAMVTWGGKALDSLGLSKQSALDAANTFGGLFAQMGAGDQDAARLSQRMVKLAVDIAAAEKVPLPAALSAIQGGLVGQYDTLKRLDIVIDENVVKQYAMSNGLASASGEMSVQQETQARLGVILQQGARFTDAYAKSADDGSKSTQKAQEAAKDASAELGQSLIPAIKAGAGAVRFLSEGFEHLPGPVQTGTAALLTIGVVAGPILSVTGRVLQLSQANSRAAKTATEVASGAQGAATSSSRLRTALAGIGVTAGMVAVGYAFDKMQERARGVREEIGRSLTAVGSDTQDQLNEAQRQLQEAQAVIASGGKGESGPSVVQRLLPIGGDDGRVAAVGKARQKVDELQKTIQDLRAQLKGQAADADDAAGALGAWSTGLVEGASSVERAAKASQDWSKTLGGMSAALDAAAATRTLASEQAKLADLLDQSDEQAERRRAVADAQDDVARANERVTETETALATAKAGVSDIEREQLQLARDQAAERQKTAKRDAEAAQKHVDRLRAAGRSPKAIQDAEDAVVQARLGSRQADEDARKSQQDLDDARVGSPAYAKRVAEAERDVRDARDQSTEAAATLKKAQDELTPSAEKLAERQRAIADQLDRVIRASENEWAAKIAAGMATASGASKGLYDELSRLGPLVAGDPVLSAILGAALTGAISGPEVEVHSGHLKFRARGGPVRRGDIAVVGEEGPEIVQFDGAGQVWPNGTRPPGLSLVRGGDGGSMGGVQIVRVVERHETHAGDEVHFHGSDRELVREYETMRRREQVSRSFSDASSNDWTR